MAYTIASPYGQRLFDNLAPWQTDDLARYCDAIGTMFDEVDSLVSEIGSDGDSVYTPTWGKLFDVDQDPLVDIAYLGQYVGVSVPVGTADTVARSLVRAEAGQNRGTVASIRAAIQRAISTPWAPNTAYASGVLVTYGTPVVYYKTTTSFTSATTFSTSNLTVVDPTTQYQLLERTNQAGTADAYWLTIVVRPEQLTPTSDTTQLLAAVNAVKPGGILLNIVVTDATPWTSLVGAWSGLSGAWNQL